MFFFLPSGLQAVEIKRNTWDVGLTLNRIELRDSENSLLGNSGQFQVGRSYLAERWRLAGSVDVIMGPYGEIRDERVETDFFGTGISARTDYSFFGTLRSPGGSWGTTLGVNYSDIVGRSVQNGLQDENNQVITRLTMRATTFIVSAGFFRAWLVPARQQGNTPELLQTRVEGYIFSISGGYPVQSSYSVRYDLATIEENGDTGAKEQRKRRGSLEGYTVVASLSALLGF